MSNLAATGVRCDWGRWMSHWQLDLRVYTQPHHLCPGAGSPSTLALVSNTDMPGALCWPQKTWHPCAHAQGHAVLSLAQSLGCSPRLQGPGHPCHVLRHVGPVPGRLSRTQHRRPRHPAHVSTTPRCLPPHSRLPRRRRIHALPCNACGVYLLWNPPPLGRGALPRKGASLGGSSCAEGAPSVGTPPRKPSCTQTGRRPPHPFSFLCGCVAHRRSGILPTEM